MKRALCIALALAALALGGCKTMFTKGGGDYRDGESAYKLGDYDVAASKAIEALAKNPDFPEAKELLSRSTKEAPAALLKEIESLKSGGKAFAIDDIYKNYKTLEKLHKVVSASAFAAQYPTTSYEKEQKAAFDAACEEHYAAGAALLRKGDFRSARGAIEQFEGVQHYTKSYKDTAALMAKAKEAAVAAVAVVDRDTGGFGTHDLEGATIKAFSSAKGKDAGLMSFKTSKDLGLAPWSDLGKAMAAAKAKGADFLVFIECKSEGKFDNPFLKSGEMLGDVFKIDVQNFGYAQTYAGSAQAYDVATGAPIGGKASFSKSFSDYVKVTKIIGGNQATLNLQNYGKTTCNVYDIPNAEMINPPNGNACEIMSQIVSDAQRVSLEDIAAAASFADIKKLGNNFYGMEKPIFLFHDLASGGYGNFFNEDRPTNERLAANSAKAREKIASRAMDMAEIARKDFSKIGAQVADDIASGLVASLK